MAKNANLHSAKQQKNDEFYTRYEDIQAELNHYEKHFEGKTVLCNCDDPFESNFCKFFLRNFNYLKLKRLICTSYAGSVVVGTKSDFKDANGEPLQNGHGYVMDITSVPMANGRGVSDDDIYSLLHSPGIIKPLKGDGDFRSDECIEYLKAADIICTNPPFSLFREYVALLMQHEKKFVIIGNKNAITYKEFFPLLKDNKVWIGYFSPTEFDTPNGKTKKVNGLCRWFTNLDIKKRHENLILYKQYNPEDYPKYDNYNAINVDKVELIPCDYDSVMGVPITFMDKYNPEQFEIIGISKSPIGNHLRTKIYDKQIQYNKDGSHSKVTKLNDGASIKSNTIPDKRPFYEIKGQYYIAVYPRILIKKK